MIPFKFKQAIRIENIRHNANSLERADNSDLWKECKQFLNEWYNHHDYIEALSSGSTGTPKVIHLKKEFVLASAKRTCTYFKLNSSSELLLALSPKHIAGKMMLIRAMTSGANIHLTKNMSHPISSFQGHVDFAALVPMQMLNDFEKTNYFKNIDTILLGGSTVSKLLSDKLQQLTTKCYQSYGMTETASHVAIRRLNGENLTSEYTALPGINFSHDKQDRLIVHFPGSDVPKICTNDLVKLINKTSFEWIGRLDNVINSGGIKLFPADIEEKLKPYLPQPFYISSTADDLLGNKIVLTMESKNLMKDDFLNEVFTLHLSPYEKPREIRYVDEITFSPLGKIIRQ